MSQSVDEALAKVSPQGVVPSAFWYGDADFLHQSLGVIV